MPFLPLRELTPGKSACDIANPYSNAAHWLENLQAGLALFRWVGGSIQCLDRTVCNLEQADSGRGVAVRAQTANHSSGISCNIEVCDFILEGNGLLHEVECMGISSGPHEVSIILRSAFLELKYLDIQKLKNHGVEASTGNKNDTTTPRRERDGRELYRRTVLNSEIWMNGSLQALARYRATVAPHETHQTPSGQG